MAAAADTDTDTNALVEQLRGRRSSAMTRAEVRATAFGTAGFLAAAATLAVVEHDASRPAPLLWTAVLLVSFAVASGCQFEVGSGSAVASQVAFVPMLFALPPSVVPLVAAAGYGIAAVPQLLRGEVHPGRLLTPLSCCWYTLGPALVLTAAGSPAASFDRWPVLLAALAAQTGADALSTTIRERLVHGLRPRTLLVPLGWVAAIDAMLSPIGLAVAVAAVDEPAAFVAVPALIALLALFGTQWRQKIDQALELRDERAAKADLERLSRTDALTGVLNRRGWDEGVDAAVEQARRDGTALCVALLDLDHFKRFNDTNGHQAGDRLLRAAGANWASFMRADDLLARYGGEEFAAAFPCELAEAREIAERLRRAAPAGITCSIGLARWDGRETAERLQRRADDALYRAKDGGRDRIVVDDPAAAVAT